MSQWKTTNTLETNGKIEILSKERNISNKEIGYVKKNPIEILELKITVIKTLKLNRWVQQQNRDDRKKNQWTLRWNSKNYPFWTTERKYTGKKYEQSLRKLGDYNNKIIILP